MCDSGIEDFPAGDTDTLGEGMRRAAKLGLPVAVHAESPSQLKRPPAPAWRDFVASRPVEAELAAIETALVARRARPAARCTSCTSRAARASSWSPRPRGSTPPCETCPHYLTLDRGRPRDARHRAPSAHRRCARPRARGALAAPAAATSTLVASDHSPCPPEHEGGRLHRRLGRHRRLPVAAAARARTPRPGRRGRGSRRPPSPRASPSPRRAYEPGADADLVLIDLRERHAPELHDRHRLSPFAGRPLTGPRRAHARARRDRLPGRPASSPSRWAPPQTDKGPA